MNNLKTYKIFERELKKNNYEILLEGNIMNVIKRIPFIGEHANMLVDIINKVKTEVMSILKGVNNDNGVIDSLASINMSDFKKSEFDISLKESMDKDNKVEKIARKISNILGNIALGSGIITAIVSATITIIEQSAYNAQPWFIAFAVLMAISIVAKSIGAEV